VLLVSTPWSSTRLSNLNDSALFGKIILGGDFKSLWTHFESFSHTRVFFLRSWNVSMRLDLKLLKTRKTGMAFARIFRGLRIRLMGILVRQYSPFAYFPMATACRGILILVYRTLLQRPIRRETWP
jgi:hypothetical protein